MIRILHVEDDPDIREISEMALMMSDDFDMIQCESGDAALAIADELSPDVLLLDMMMPGMTGLQLLTELRNRPAYQTIPAIFMTARAQPSEVQELRDAGAIDIIVKPFDPVSLAEQIKTSLNKAGH